jgi:hypothetical protein
MTNGTADRKEPAATNGTLEGAAKESQRRMKLTWTATGESATIDLLENEAPQTCEWIWGLLPMECSPAHSRHSSGEIVIKVDAPQVATRENMVQMPLPGELFYFYESRMTIRGVIEQVGQVRLVYGRGILLRDLEGSAVYATLFGRIPGDWKTDWTSFAAACRRVQSGEPQALRLEKGE